LLYKAEKAENNFAFPLFCRFAYHHSFASCGIY